jgi:acid stress-induced BolA-like protein IbaG/YrbA
MNAEQIKEIIAAGMACDFIHLEGDGRHWYATIVSPAFEGRNLVARQRSVYATLGDKMARDEVHALSMRTYTPAEWAQARQDG